MLFVDWDVAPDSDVAAGALDVPAGWCGVMNDIASAMATHSQKKFFCRLRTFAVPGAAFTVPAAAIGAASSDCGRSRTNRAAMAAASGDFQLRPETRSRIESSVFSAIALGMAANRVASSHGSALVRAKAEITLRCIPFASSQTGANRKSS